MHIKAIFYSFFLVLLFSSFGCTSFQTPYLTHKQMYEDYDYMVTVLKDMMSHAIPIRESYDIDVWKKLTEYREKISDVENTQEFAVLVGFALQACKGHHLGLKIIPLSTDENYLKGLNNPMMLGRGVNPFVFALPNSNLTIQVEPALDITGSQKAEECLHTKVEVELKLTPHEYFDYKTLSVDDPNIRSYLLKKDPFLQKAFEIIQSRKPAMPTSHITCNN